MEGEFGSSCSEFVVALCGVGESWPCLGSPIWRRGGTVERGVAESERELGRRGNMGVMGGSKSLDGSEESAATGKEDMSENDLADYSDEPQTLTCG